MQSESNYKEKTTELNKVVFYFHINNILQSRYILLSESTNIRNCGYSNGYMIGLQLESGKFRVCC